jgi:hypothetical protein
MKRLRSILVNLRSLLMPWSEALVWLAALLLLAFVPPGQTQQTFCVWHHLGIESCPGCGLGHSIAEAFKGQIAASFFKHPLGLFAIALMAWRIVWLVYFNLRIIKTLKQKPYVENL